MAVAPRMDRPRRPCIVSCQVSSPNHLFCGEEWDEILDRNLQCPDHTGDI
jgi:predicted nucleic acid-binding Zn ribbon protein